ncbi:MAG: S9 family peptidase [Firmicutes bacterium]|nr:S9 family peptidase [Alicyclobacillaceae bacterium]MCL6496341.1 S9 family peptidase [Bacillota bacterium]
MAEFALERFFAYRRYAGNLVVKPPWLYFIADFTGRFDVWRMPLSGGWPEQLTAFREEHARLLCADPAGQGLWIQADVGGSEAWGVFVRPAGRGWPRRWWWAPPARLQLSPRSVSPDRHWLLAASNRRQPQDLDLVVLEADTGNVVTPLAEGGYWQPALWVEVRGQLWAVGAQALANVENTLWAFAFPGHDVLRLTPPGEAVFNPLEPSPDGEGLLVLTNWESEATGIAVVDWKQPGQVEWVWRGPWEVEWAAWDPRRRTLVWIANEAGASRLWRAEWAGGRVQAARPAPGWPQGTVQAATLAPDSGLVVILSQATHPPEIWRYDLDRETGSALTEGWFGGIPSEALAVPELIQWRSPDGLAFSGWFYPARVTGPAPAVLAIHGGPESQERPGYQAWYQYLAHVGVHVVAPNFRGSTGFGRSFQRRIYRDWGGAEIGDLETVADWLARHPRVDPGRMALFGASYGGFAVLTLAARRPAQWRAAVDLFGPTDLVQFVQRVPPSWRRFMQRWVGDPEADAERLRARSPMTWADQIRCPVLVLQGARDVRVVPAESEQLVAYLKQRGTPVEYHRFDDEGHGFLRRENQLRAFELVADFLGRHLGIAVQM